jgi:hypothetical protein
MRPSTEIPTSFPADEWLEEQCREVEESGRCLAMTVGQVNLRTEQARLGKLGRRRRITETQIREVETACRKLHDVQVRVQNALFDCEHEMRALRERDISPAELLVDGDTLIVQYRFLRRRARVIDGMLAYLPVVTAHAGTCLQSIQHLRENSVPDLLITAPDCGFALVALEQLRDEESQSRP